MLLLAATSAPAVAQTGTLSIALGDRMTVTDRGLFGTVPVSLTCTFDGVPDFGNLGNINIEIRQRQGNKIVRGGGSLPSGFGPEACDGVTRTFEIRVDAFFSPFRMGSGLVKADAFACGTVPTGEFVCLNATTDWQTLDFRPAPAHLT